MSQNFCHYPSLVDRAILVSGGGSGIGAFVVTRLAEMGARVGFIDIDQTASEALCKTIAEGHAKHSPVYEITDVTDISALQASLQSLAAQLGPIAGLVNNAANDTRHAVATVDPEFWRRALSVNLDHQFFAAQALADGMKQLGGGSIVNMGSISWRVGIDNMPAYVSAKSAIEGLTNGLARELGPHNIRVNCITPGFIRTERQEKLWLTPELERQVFESQCLNEFIEPVYVANMVAFLLSDDSRMCTSSVFAVHGGWISS